MEAVSYGALRSSGTHPAPAKSGREDGPLRRAADSFGQRFFPLGYWREFREILRLQLPAFLTCFFQFFLQTISVLMSGHLSKEELDAVALSCSLINVAGLGIGLGLSTGCDTYFSQTFGSNNKKRMGLYLQRSLIVMYMALVPVYCLHLNIKPLLLLLGQDPHVSDMAAQYILLFMPGLFFDFTFLVLARYLQTQNIVNPPLVCALVGNIFNVSSQYVAIFVLGLRYEASAVCQAASIAVMCLCMIAYFLVSGAYKETWGGWTREAWSEIGGFVRLAIPGLIFVGLEELSFEVGTFIAGTISTLQLAAQGIVFQSATLSYMVSLGMSIAVNIRVGQHLGSGSIAAARHTYRVAATMILCSSLCFVLMFSLGNRFVAGLFSTDPLVVEATAQLMLVYAAFPIFDGISATASGVLKGCGKQLIGAVINIVAYEVIALPIGIPLALLTDLQARGIWIGLLAGLSSESVIFWFIISRIDWVKEVAIAQARASGTELPPSVASEENSEKQSLLGHSRSVSVASRGAYHSDVDVEILPTTPLLPTGKIVLQRVLTILFLLAILAAAVGVRVFQSPRIPITRLCLPNATVTSAGNFSICDL